MTLPNLTPDEMARVEALKQRTADLKAKGEYEATRLYLDSPEQPIMAVLKSMATTKQYPIDSFYRADLVVRALTEIEVSTSPVEYKTNGDPIYIDRQEIKQTLLDNVEQLIGFYSKLEGFSIEVTTHKTLPDAKIAKLAKKYTQRTNQQILGVGPAMGAYSIVDIHGLRKAIKTARPQTYQTYGVARKNMDTLSTSTGFYMALDYLGKNLGITPAGNEAGLTISIWHTELRQLVLAVLDRIRTGVSTLYTNIPQHDTEATPLPVLDDYMITLDSVSQSPEVISLIGDSRRHRNEPGVPIVGQLSLLDGILQDRHLQARKDKAEKDGADFDPGDGKSKMGLAEWILADDVQQLLRQAGTYALNPVLRFLTEYPAGGDISITDLMYYDDYIRDTYPPSKGIPRTTREAFINSLRILLGWQFEVPVRVAGGTELRHLTLIKGTPFTDKTPDEITEMVERGEKPPLIKEVRGLELDRKGATIRDYKLLGVYDDRRADYLKSPEAKLLWNNVRRYMVSKNNNQLKKTVAGEPLVITVDTLLRGVVKTKSNPRWYYQWATKQLNEMVSLGLISKWYNEAGNQAIGSKPNTKKLHIYPSPETMTRYRTVEMYEQQKRVQDKTPVQKVWLSDLKKLRNQYGNDTELAGELNVTRDELNSLLSGSSPIPQDVADKVIGLVV